MTALAGGDLCETGTTVSNRFCPDVLSNQVADFLSFILGHFICHIIVYEHRSFHRSIPNTERVSGIACVEPHFSMFEQCAGS